MQDDGARMDTQTGSLFGVGAWGDYLEERIFKQAQDE